MGAAICVGSHRLQPFDPIFMKCIRHCNTDSSKILMVAGSKQLHRTSVQQKTFLRIHCDRAEAADCLVRINQFILHKHFRDHFIYIGFLNIPYLRILNRKFCLNLRLLPGFADNAFVIDIDL